MNCESLFDESSHLYYCPHVTALRHSCFPVAAFDKTVPGTVTTYKLNERNRRRRNRLPSSSSSSWEQSSVNNAVIPNPHPKPEENDVDINLGVTLSAAVHF